MAGLLSDVLPWVYSKGNQARRQLNGLLSDPMGTFESAAQTMQGSHQKLQGLLDQAQAGNAQAQGDAAEMALGGLLGFAPVGMTVWHGSPHTFSKFDASKIGTGEGAQMYGHGIYTAQAPEVAREYAKNVKDMGTVAKINEELSRLAKVMSADEVGYGVYRSDAGRQAKAQYDALMAQRSGITSAPGNLYKVDLPDEHIAKMLDWDKPLTQQSPEVQRALLKAQAGNDPLLAELLDFSPAGMQMQGLVPTAKGAAAYKTMAEQTGGAAKAAEKLRQAGIPGIRYLDGGSRGAGSGSSNFVVFPGNEDLLSILERVPVR